MAIDDDAPTGGPDPSSGEEPRLRRRRVKVRRKQQKLPPPVRIALLIGLPIALWTGIFLVGRALL